MKSLEISRRNYFSCGHRYFNPKWSEEKNREIFGSCYSEHGHGHNYILEAYFKGAVNEETGMILDLKEIDNILNKVTSPLDHHFINTDVEEFKEKVPTTENLALWCFEKISAELASYKGIQLSRLRLYESEDLWADVYA